MHPLDSQRRYTSKSRQLVLGSLQLFDRQCREGYRGGQRAVFPKKFALANEVVVSGMGGAALGTDVIRSVYGPELRIPLTIVNGYTLPGSVGKETLLMLASYSGTTEEVLATAREGRRRKAMIAGFTSGGPLAAVFRTHADPWYHIEGRSNPSKQPRMGLGYTTMGPLGLLSSARVLRTDAADINTVVHRIVRTGARLGPDVTQQENRAKQLAAALLGRIPVVVGAEHLVGSMHVFANQLQETAKTFAVPFNIPELNHHLLEGLCFPAEIRKLVFLFPVSTLLSPRIRQRLRITESIVRKRGAATVRVPIRGENRLTQAFDLLTIAGYTSFYLSVLHNVDPLAIPSVDELKERLARYQS